MVKNCKKYFLRISVFIAGLLLLSACREQEEDPYLVKTQGEFNELVKTLKPGDTITLANGVWTDFEILFEATGQKDAPITLTAEDKGKVIISGQSNLRLAGEYLVVSGLVFKDGYTPTSSVISYRKNKQTLANYSRITEVVIDDFSNPERTENDYWIAMYGRHNRFDHNHVQGKRNKGVTMAVRLDTEESRENYHQIDHNYFGPRSILGSNGGETLRIGTSHYSLSDSFTTVENNYFDRCDGELEIISNKSGSNVIRGNVFFESRGTLTLRHGNGNKVEGNVFFGNGVDHTGGIRVINKQQSIQNNYMEGLAGYRFGGALVVMNGVPNSPINRYHQVDGVVIKNNTIANSDHIQLAAGSDQERSAVPVNSQFISNIIFNQPGKDVFTVYDDISGIEFAQNPINYVNELSITEGFENIAFEMQRAKNGLLYPVEMTTNRAGISTELSPVKKQQVGVSWYEKPGAIKPFGFGKTIGVEPGYDTLAIAVKQAESGDIISLAEGDYSLSRTLVIDKALQITAKKAGSSVNVEFDKTSLFEIVNGGSLFLKGLNISGVSAPDSSGNSVIRTQRSSMPINYRLILEAVNVSNLDINHSFNFLTVAKSTFADEITIRDSHFNNISGAVLKLNAETDDYGIYNAEYVTISNSSFTNIEGPLTDFYRGGTDESTFGPHFTLNSSVLQKVGQGKRNKSKAAIHLHGVQLTGINNNQFLETLPISIKHTVGEPVTVVSNNLFKDTSQPLVRELNSDKTNTAKIDNNSFVKSNQ